MKEKFPVNVTNELKIGSVNSFLTVKGKSRSWEEHFSKYFGNVNVNLNFKKEMFIPLKLIPKGELCWLGNWWKVADQTSWYMKGNPDTFTSLGNR